MIAPITITVLLVIVIIISLFNLDSQKKTVGELYDVRISHLRKVEEINENLKTLNMNLYRLLSWSSLNYPADKIEGFSKEQADFLGDQISNIADFSGGKDLIPQEKTLLKSLSGNMDFYANDARLIIALARTDPGLAGMSIASVESKYTLLNNNLKALVEVEEYAVKSSYNNMGLYFVSAFVFFGIISAVTILLLVMLAVAVTAWIGCIVGQFEKVSREFEEGNLNVELDIQNRDELGKLAKVFNSLIARLRESYMVIGEMSRRIGRNSEDLSSRSNLLSESSEKQAQSSKNVFDIMGEYLKALENNSSSIEKQMGIISDAVAAIAQLNSGVQNIVRNIDDLKKKIAENARIAADSRENFKAFEKNVLNIGEFLEGLAISIHKFEEYSENIDQILTVIRNISDETNMLAMNAAIEAAHAGDAGEGFAIVAKEVRKLSESSASSATEIGVIINSIKDGIKEAGSRLEAGSANTKNIADSARDSGKSLEELMITIETVNKMAAEIADVTQGQGKSALEIQKHSESLKSFSIGINKAMAQQKDGANRIIDTISQVSSSIEENARASEDLSRLAEALKNDSRKLAETVHGNINV
jgi:methyl-accepting chemotaxis protein